jgi:adenylate kinase family enzyme
LAAALGARHIELDSIFHQPNWTPLDDDEFRRRADEATREGRWVVDGNYSAVREVVWNRADTVVWFDLPYLLVLGRTIRRTVRRAVTREELWNGNREPMSNLWSINPETSIIAWTATRHPRYRKRYADAARSPHWAHLRFVRLRSQAEAEGFLAGVAATTYLRVETTETETAKEG